MSPTRTRPVFLPCAALALAVLAGAACQREAPAGTAQDAPATAASQDPKVASPVPGVGAPGQDDRHTLQAGVPPARIALPAADTPTPPIASGARIEYLCEDGNSLVVEYHDASASFALAGGQPIVLPRAGSVTGKGADVYASDAAGLQRLGNVVQVEEASGARRTCAEASASA